MFGIKMNPLQHSFLVLASIMIKPSLMQYGMGLPHPQVLPWTETSDLIAHIAPMAQFHQYGGILRLMQFGIKMNPLCHSVLASIMVKPSLMQCGMEL